MPSLQILYASTSGHTEYVVDVLRHFLASKNPSLSVTATRIEQATAESLASGDVLLLAASTWNTGGNEGQLNPYMYAYILKTVAKADLKGKPVAVIGLGDHRYRYTCAAADHLETFVKTHNGKFAIETLRMVNEPYGQEEKVEQWGQKLLSAMKL